MRTRIFFPVNNTDYLLHTDSHGFSFHTEYRGQSRFSSSHGISRKVTVFLLHTEYRGQSRIFLVTRLVLGPTDRREVIIELSNFCLP